MRYDLELILEMCQDVGFSAQRRTEQEIAVHLHEGATLLFVNSDGCDAIMGLDGTPWHTHGELECSDRHGSCTCVDYLDVITGLADGTVLLCERWIGGALSDRWLVHRDYVDEFRFMESGDEIRIRRIVPGRPPSTTGEVT